MSTVALKALFLLPLWRPAPLISVLASAGSQLFYNTLSDYASS